MPAPLLRPTRPVTAGVPARVTALATALVTALVTGLLSALLLVPAAAVSPDPGVGGPSGGDPYFRLDGNGGYNVRHYRIHDRYRPGTDRLRGRTVLVATAKHRLRVFHLDLVLTPDQVRVDGARARFSKPRRHELRVVPRRPVAAGDRFTVSVRYHGRPSRLHAEGMAPGTDLYFHRRGETLAMGEPQNGAWWFAANETPTDKATFSVRVDVPRGLQVVSGGELVSRRTRNGWTSRRWQVTEPITTYLAFFAAGRFHVERGRSRGLPFTYAVCRRLSPDEQRRSLRLLQRTGGIVAWLTGRFGAYPYRSIGGVVPGIGIPYALETATGPVYPYVGGAGKHNVLLLVHENAHQWFGNDVSVRRWRDVWLNEGFATYAEWLWTATHGGDPVATQLQRAYRTRPADSSFWDVTVVDPGPARMWDDPTYVRGAMTLAALRARIGKSVFADLLRTWLERHGTSHGLGGHGTTAQFRRLAERMSGQDLDAFFDTWLDTTRRPASTAANGL